jgi:hypothetical protein
LLNVADRINNQFALRDGMLIGDKTLGATWFLRYYLATDPYQTCASLARQLTARYPCQYDKIWLRTRDKEITIDLAKETEALSGDDISQCNLRDLIIN